MNTRVAYADGWTYYGNIVDADGNPAGEDLFAPLHGLTNYALERKYQQEIGTSDKPVVWPVGAVIPVVDEQWKPHRFYGDQTTDFKCKGCGLHMHEHRQKQAEHEK